MVKIKLIDGKTYDLRIARHTDNSDFLSLEFLPGTETLEEIEEAFGAENVSKILLVNESDETLRIFNGFITLTNLEKVKDVAIDTEVVDEEEVVTYSDVIRITLRKENELEKRMSNIEETVDLLVLDSLGI